MLLRSFQFDMKRTALLNVHGSAEIIHAMTLWGG